MADPKPQPEPVPASPAASPEDVVEEMEELTNDDDLDIEDSFDGGLFDPMQQLAQMLVTESGVPLVDVLQGIQESLDKQNKILYKLVSVVDAKLR